MTDTKDTKGKTSHKTVSVVPSAAVTTTSSLATNNIASQEPQQSKSKEPTPASTVSSSTDVCSAAPTVVRSGKVDVENFVPDAGDFDNFLDDDNTTSGASSNQIKNGYGLDSR